ncbi:carboxypeptidase-like regulatory domain-containing protein [Desertivirga xinjiangensis]|uniref:carboxypeptidase-like regulatory domain-containing protein n=1 Tax=Desertivirga xinjiangensis TaxID=539206 RepID=UPI00210CFCB8|nr:carboxypeptidase-like regulatory domain-containing protein [Pedobacter xinjiangensis]
MKKALILIFFICCVVDLLGQDRQVQGIVFDRDSKQRLARVYIYNLRTHKGFYNNSKGEFTTTTALKGDTLIAALQGYRVDTITVQNTNTLLFYLKRISILLQEVTVSDSVKSPSSRHRANQEAHNDIYRKGEPGDLFNVGGTSGFGAGLSIDALWSLLSREGKNARYLQEILERDYHEMMVDYRFNRNIVRSVTGLSGNDLADFMQQYRPSYYFVLEANDYALIAYIKNTYKQYLANPAANRLPPLVTPVKP